MPGARPDPRPDPDLAPQSGAGRAAARRVSREPGGPFLIEGPVEVVLEDGTIVRSDRPVVALCVCQRSRIFPWCDTSHRGRRTAGSTGLRTPSAETSQWEAQ